MNSKSGIPYKIIGAIFIMILANLSCQIGFDTGMSSATSQATPRPTFESIANDNPVVLSLQDDTLTRLYERVNPGVVAIWVITNKGVGQGSGFVVDKEGHIVTNYHVVEDANQVEINFPSDYKTYGKVIARDPDSDLGVVKVNAPEDELHPLPMGDSAAVKIGQTVIAIGNPFGYSGTMTIGIVSAKGRTLSSLHSTPGGDYYTAGDLIQTDAAINPGNSGGPLLNLQGEVIGINRAIETNAFNDQGEPVNTGIGFALASNIVRRVLPSLISEGYYDYPYLGVDAMPELTLTAQKQLNLSRASGVYVTRVTPNGPSARAGIKTGDLIIAVDGKTVHNFGEMISYLFNNKSPGDRIDVTLIRGSNQKDLQLELGKRP